MDYGLCTTKKFNDKLSEVHKSILDKMTKYRKKLDKIQDESKVFMKYKK